MQNLISINQLSYVAVFLITTFLLPINPTISSKKNNDLESYKNIVNNVIKPSTSENFMVFGINEKIIIIDSSSSNQYSTYENQKITGLKKLNNKLDKKNKQQFDMYFKRIGLSSSISYITNHDYWNDKCPANYVYFALYKNGEIHVEFYLPTMLLCSELKILYPVEDNILNPLNNIYMIEWPNG